MRIEEYTLKSINKYGQAVLRANGYYVLRANGCMDCLCPAQDRPRGLRPVEDEPLETMWLARGLMRGW